MHVGDDDREVGEQQELERLQVTPAPIRIWLKMPLRPRNGIQAIIRMMLEVRNGTVQTRNKTVCTAGCGRGRPGNARC